jgi:hypothetical protein
MPQQSVIVQEKTGLEVELKSLLLSTRQKKSDHAWKYHEKTSNLIQLDPEWDKRSTQRTGKHK